jgi:maleate isomerase
VTGPARAGLLADAEVALISWAGTSGFWLGADKEDEVLEQAGRAAGVPVTSSRAAVLAALGERPAAPVGVLTPYVPEVHRRVVAAVTDACGGGRVVADRGLGIEANLGFAAIPAAVIDAELRRLADLGAESLAVICTNVPGLAGGHAYGPPGSRRTVVDSVLATLWHAARLSGGYRGSYAGCYQQVAARLRAAGGAR